MSSRGFATIAAGAVLVAWLGTTALPKAQAPPLTLAQLGPLDHTERIRLFNASAPAIRASLWRQQLGDFLASAPELTADQRLLVADAIAFATPTVFSLPMSQQASGVSDRYHELCRAVQAHFDRAEHRAAFGTLGPIAQPTSAASIATPPLWPNVLDLLGPAAHADIPLCSCNNESWCNYCVDVANFFCEGCICEHQSWGCGCLWAAECTQRCIQQSGFCQ